MTKIVFDEENLPGVVELFKNCRNSNNIITYEEADLINFFKDAKEVFQKHATINKITLKELRKAHLLPTSKYIQRGDKVALVIYAKKGTKFEEIEKLCSLFIDERAKYSPFALNCEGTADETTIHLFIARGPKLNAPENLKELRNFEDKQILLNMKEIFEILKTKCTRCKTKNCLGCTLSPGDGITGEMVKALEYMKTQNPENFCKVFGNMSCESLDAAEELFQKIAKEMKWIYRN